MKEKLNCIMIIDDDEPTNFLNEMLIGEANCTNYLKIADSGPRALEYLKNINAYDEENGSIPPDLIFLDINMPCMDGWEFLEEFKNLRNERLANTVIIMLTTSLNPDDKQKAEDMTEVAGFERKPFTTEIINRIIDRHFNLGLVQLAEAAAFS